MPSKRGQLSLFQCVPVVHYFDRNGALRSGTFVRRIRVGRRKGSVVVRGPNGRSIVPARIRNIDYPYIYNQ